MGFLLFNMWLVSFIVFLWNSIGGKGFIFNLIFFIIIIWFFGKILLIICYGFGIGLVIVIKL